MENGKKYRFSWENLGDIRQGRPNLGMSVDVAVYRLMQYTFRDVVEREYGTEAADRIFRDAGYLAGDEFYKNVLGEKSDFNEFVNSLQSVLSGMGIGILRIEESDPGNGRFVLTVSEDLDCSGLPETGDSVCTYDEGFLAALLGNFTKSDIDVKEVDCWCTGDRSCRFLAQRKE